MELDRAGRLRPDLLFGRSPVFEALRAGRGLKRILLAETAHGGRLEQILAAAERSHVPIVRVKVSRLDSLGTAHQGVAAEAEPFRYTSVEQLLDVRPAPHQLRPPVLLFVDSVQDPQNLGALMRTAAAVGALGVVIPAHRAAQITPAVAKASAGAVEHLAAAREPNLAHALGAARSRGFWIVGLAPEATLSLWDVDLHGPVALVVGAEARGLRPLIRRACDELAAIPMLGSPDSLNAAVAGSIALYEALRQRSGRSGPAA